MDLLPEIVTGSLSRAPWGWALLFTVVIALIKAWPVLQLQAMNAAAQLRGERRDALHDCTERMDLLEGKLNVALGHIHQLDLKLVGTVSAYRILHDRMTETSPDDQALKHAQTVFKTTWDGPVEQLGPLT